MGQGRDCLVSSLNWLTCQQKPYLASIVHLCVRVMGQCLVLGTSVEMERPFPGHGLRVAAEPFMEPTASSWAALAMPSKIWRQHCSLVLHCPNCPQSLHRDSGGYTSEVKRKGFISVDEPFHCRDLKLSHADGPQLYSLVTADSVQLQSGPK